MTKPPVRISACGRTSRVFKPASRIIAVMATLLVFATIASSPAAAQDKWSFEERVDDLTDLKIAVASYQSTQNTGAYVQCKQTEEGKWGFSVIFDFGKYLGRDLVPVRYRIDKGELVQDEWLPNARGTGVINYAEAADIVRQVLRGSKLIAEATDTRGLSYRIRISSAGATETIKPVMQQCGISEIALHEKIDGLQKEVSLEIERWGPKQINVNKKILNSIGVYDGIIDDRIDASFALTIQKFYNDQLSKCKQSIQPESETTWCSFSAASRFIYEVPIDMVIYESAQGDLKREAGKLGIGD